MRLSDYVVEFLHKEGVTDCFTVVGGGAMFLNASFANAKGMTCTHFHHEQGAAMAAESYARYGNKVAALCVTSGPGGTNTITGVLGGYLDSIPMFIISGQTRYDTTVRYEAGLSGDSESIQPTDTHYGTRKSGLPRSIGDQEYDITHVAERFCKYAAMIESPEGIRYHLEKAWHLMKTGRPGPVWIDIPVNFQSMDIDPDTLRGYEPPDDNYSEPAPSIISDILAMIRAAKRPVLYAGGGVRISGGFDAFRKLVDKLGIPVCTYWNSIDLIEDEHPLYCGRAGNMGGRAGNFAVQNSDLLLVIGSRLSIRQVGYNYHTWARAAKVIMVDIDEAELNKHTIHVDLKIRCDAKAFMEAALRELDSFDGSFPRDGYLSPAEDWRRQCLSWKKTYPVVREDQINTGDDKVNVYGFIRALSEALPQGSLTAVSNGACCVAGHQAYVIKPGTRFIVNNAVASMGYGLPAAIGLCIASGKRDTVCLEGDGSIMMNLQELQTIITGNLPVKIFLINNEGYQSIRITQNNFFGDAPKVGIGPDSGDISFPSYRKIAEAFGYRYLSITSGKELSAGIRNALESQGPLICEVFTDTKQVWEPKNTAKCEADGSIISPPLEDMAPFLSREELQRNMYI
ncbi:thiamine pyrophosphate-binding protein [Butyrivibrio sp. FCS014]|uniref:thiamine pyrophosphate-binding protein n=1 Tax=Butyrivibrio sp. FCS014 TaxID=1408304 RepID=UPI0004AC9DEE|nr:thiamine pyrophosphate-binding protein [Butyrivibrio sp. FCS014]